MWYGQGMKTTTRKQIRFIESLFLQVSARNPGATDLVNIIRSQSTWMNTHDWPRNGESASKVIAILLMARDARPA